MTKVPRRSGDGPELLEFLLFVGICSLQAKRIRHCGCEGGSDLTGYLGSMVDIYHVHY